MFKGACHLDDPAHRTIIFSLPFKSQEVSALTDDQLCAVCLTRAWIDPPGGVHAAENTPDRT
jgi:hypothetical protein